MANLRLGQGGSFQNRCAEAGNGPEPEVGMGATILMFTDRYAATVVEVSADKKTVVIQQDRAINVSKTAEYGSQGYRFEPDPDAARRTFTKRKNGMWIEKGSAYRNGQAIAIGFRSEYYDPSF